MKMNFNLNLNLNRQQLSLLATIVIGILLFAAASWRYIGFATPGVFINLIEDNAFLGIAAIGMTFVILSGGIDLSVGSVIGMTSILSALLMEKYQLSPALVIPGVVLLGALFGTLMGLIISLFELAPFLVTLAGMFFARGMAYTLSLDSIPMSHPVFSAVSQFRLPLGIASVPAMSLIFLAFVAVGIYISTQTRFGRAVYALGGNSISAKLMGLKVQKTQVLVYALSGTTAALAGIAYTFYTSSGNATAAMGLELDAIAAVVIGGTLLSGGSGTVFGTLIGTLILGMIQTIITFESNLSSWWTKIVIGGLLFFFVVLQKFLSHVSHRTMNRTGPKENNNSPNLLKLKRMGTAGILFFAFWAPIDASEAAFQPLSRAQCPPGQYGGAKITNGFYQLTGTHLKQGQTVHEIAELPDPAPPYVTRDGAVEIYGSAQYFIRYKNWEEYDRGGCFEIVKLDLVSEKGFHYTEVYSHPWDMRKVRIESDKEAPKEVLIGGAMTAGAGHNVPIWPDDNINRRVYFFRPDKMERWVRDMMSIVGNYMSGWVGHSYGGNLIQEETMNPSVIHADKPGQIAFFYERVSESSRSGPYKTEIFAVPMKSYDEAEPNSEVKIYDIAAQPYPATKRVGENGYLVEGPRPFQVNLKGQKFFLIGFSSGDFPTNNYHINLMWSQNLMGPYKPMLTPDHTDLLDLGVTLKNKYGLSWVGRPSFYQTPDGGYEMLFHGVIKDILPDNDYTKWPQRYQLWEFFRIIFKVKVQISIGTDGVPVLEVLAK